ESPPLSEAWPSRRAAVIADAGAYASRLSRCGSDSCRRHSWVPPLAHATRAAQSTTASCDEPRVDTLGPCARDELHESHQDQSTSLFRPPLFRATGSPMTALSWLATNRHGDPSIQIQSAWAPA